jgi:flagellar P-ring protein FlgI
MPAATDKSLRRAGRPREAVRRPRARLLACVVALLALMALALPSPADATSRIKDIADFEGIRDNMLVGYGLVVGLKGSGDSLRSAVFTKESLIGMLARLGVNTRDANLDAKNVAAVMVTAVLPPFARQGSRIDVNVGALGDAKSLLGGTLLVTPLLGADGEVYAVSQGQIAVGGFEAQGRAASVTRGVATSGRIANGAIVEREIEFELASLPSMKIALKNPDFTTAQRMAEAINGELGGPLSRPLDPGTVLLQIPGDARQNIVGLIGRIEQLRVRPDLPARVLIDEQSGVIVMGENVRISTVAIAQGNLTIRITEDQQVSQPGPFARAGETAVVDRTTIEIDDDGDRRLGILSEGVSLQDLVAGLNALGIGPRDLITILQAIKASGALQAEIEVL